MEIQMKKLLLALSLFSIIGLQGTAAPVVNVIKVVSNDGKEFNMPANIHSTTIDNLIGDLGNDANAPAIPLPNIDSKHLNHIIRLYTDPGYVLPVAYSEQRATQVTPESLLVALDYLDAKYFLEPFYIAWLNNPLNSTADVYHAAPARTVLQQMDMDRDINNLAHDTVNNNIVLQGEFTQKNNVNYRINNYAHRSHKHVSIQNLIDANKIPEIENGTLNLKYKNIVSLRGLRNLNLSGVRCLLLNNNQITSIDPQTFTNLPALETLWLSDSQITTIDPQAFTNLPALESIFLYNNQITAIDPQTFNNLLALEHLELNNNQITAIDPQTFNNLPALTYLNIDHNQITTIDPQTFTHLLALTHLYLHNNQITALDPQTFNNLPALEWIQLTNNQITTIDPQTFNNLPALKWLSLSFNQIPKEQKDQIRAQVPQDCKVLLLMNK
ncbi:MAG: hypothetical protein ACJAZS_000002 [Alteromonas naphthalenivorans]|jgi:hypothetical protein